MANNLSVLQLHIANFYGHSAVFSLRSSLSIESSVFHRGYSTIIRTFSPLKVFDSDFSKILASAFKFESNTLYSDVEIHDFLTFTPESQNIYIIRCKFISIRSQNSTSAIEIQRISTLFNFAISLSTFLNCTSCITAYSSRVCISNVCVDGDFSKFTRLGSFAGLPSGKLVFNTSYVSRCFLKSANQTYIVSFNYGDYSLDGLNFSKNSAVDEDYNGIMHILNGRYEFSLNFILFISNNASFQLFLNSGPQEKSFSNVIFANQSNFKDSSCLLCGWPAGGTISNVYDCHNSVVLDNSVGRSQSLVITGYYTDRMSFQLANISFYGVHSYSGSEFYESKQGSECPNVLLITNVTASSSSNYGLSKAMRTVFISLACLVVALAVSLVVLYISHRRKNRKISELTKVIDLDDALANMS